MAWKQLKAFNLAKMGHKKNFCLNNVRLGYGIGPKYASAKLAMNENRKKGTLHPLSTIPKNVTVPVYTSQGIWGHIEVCLKGTYYSDGVKAGKPNNSYMWGEYVNGVRVVEQTKPAPKTIKVGDSVIVNGKGTGNSKGGGGKTANFVNRKMKVVEIANGRYACNQFNKKGAATGWWTAGQIKKA